MIYIINIHISIKYSIVGNLYITFFCRKGIFMSLGKCKVSKHKILGFTEKYRVRSSYLGSRFWNRDSMKLKWGTFNRDLGIFAKYNPLSTSEINLLFVSMKSSSP